VTAADRGTLRLAGVVGGLTLALLIGYVIGEASDDGAGAAPAAPVTTATGHDHAAGTDPNHPHFDGPVTSAGNVGGLVVSSGGYTLVPVATRLARGVATRFAFRIDGPGGVPVTDFVTVHDRPMHLIVVRRDLTGYRHVHPTMAPDGTWEVELTLGAAGIWRAYADFAVIGTGVQVSGQLGIQLGVDLTVGGDYSPEAFPAPARQFTTDDGYTVTYAGTPQVGLVQPLVFRVAGADARARVFEPYLGAYGHLVALREGDLAYVHVHAESQLYRGAAKFWLVTPSPGRYRLFLDYQVDGVVRTAAFTVVV
jgi:hypothetical protein